MGGGQFDKVRLTHSSSYMTFINPLLPALLPGSSVKSSLQSSKFATLANKPFAMEKHLLNEVIPKPENKLVSRSLWQD